MILKMEFSFIVSISELIFLDFLTDFFEKLHPPLSVPLNIAWRAVSYLFFCLFLFQKLMLIQTYIPFFLNSNRKLSNLKLFVALRVSLSNSYYASLELEKIISLFIFSKTESSFESFQ